MEKYTVIRGNKAIGEVAIDGVTALELLKALDAETAVIQDFGTFGTVSVDGFYNSSDLEKDSGILPELRHDSLFFNEYGYMAFFKSL